MRTDQWTARLSEYIDGELHGQDAEALEAHLLDCADCGRVLQELRAVVARASQVIDRPPQRDLWQSIADRIAQADREAPPDAAGRRRISFSIGQLAAASIALMLLSGGTMYMLTRETAPQIASAPPAGGEPAMTTAQAVAAPVRVKSPAAENYDVAIDELEGALRDGRARLDSATVRVLESNLRTIDNAIAEARTALGRDPGNPYLNRYLDQTIQKKIQLLRRATGIVRAQT